jgi:hypothetical protein
MALPLADWASIAAIVSAMCDVIATGRTSFEVFYRERLASPETTAQAAILSEIFSTYSDEELDAIRERIEGCRRRFIEEGAGDRRARCLCSVLTDVRDGNGGVIPVNDWSDIYKRLGCSA